MANFILELIQFPVPFLIAFGVGLLMWRHPGRSHRILAATALALIVASVPATGKLLMWPQLLSAPVWRLAPERPTPVAVLVPTGGVFYALDVGWWPSASSLERLGRALAVKAKLAAAGMADVRLIVIGGPTMTSADAEADVLRQRYPHLPTSTVFETTAINTAETANAVRRILGPDRSWPLVVVTDDFHAARMAASLRAEGLVAFVQPTGESGLRDIGWRDLLPSSAGFSITSRVIHSWAGLVWYVATGRFSPADFIPDASAAAPSKS